MDMLSKIVGQQGPSRKGSYKRPPLISRPPATVTGRLTTPTENMPSPSWPSQCALRPCNPGSLMCWANH
eukprot:scaffold1839_cov332-Pavlova_lutheri.AAC.1